MFHHHFDCCCDCCFHYRRRIRPWNLCCCSWCSHHPAMAIIELKTDIIKILQTSKNSETIHDVYSHLVVKRIRFRNSWRRGDDHRFCGGISLLPLVLLFSRQLLPIVVAFVVALRRSSCCAPFNGRRFCSHNISTLFVIWHSVRGGYCPRAVCSDAIHMTSPFEAIPSNPAGIVRSNPRSAIAVRPGGQPGRKYLQGVVSDL